MIIKGITYKKILTYAGSFFVFLGVLGIFLPLFPTTPFLLIAAFCYSKGSKKHYNWIIKNKVFGKYIKDYREGKGIPLHAKVLSITTLWISIGFSVLVIPSHQVMRIIMLFVATGVTIYLIKVKTLKTI